MTALEKLRAQRHELNFDGTLETEYFIVASDDFVEELKKDLKNNLISFYDKRFVNMAEIEDIYEVAGFKIIRTKEKIPYEYMVCGNPSFGKKTKH